VDPIIEPLGKHDRAAFSCGKEPLDRCIRQQAGQDLRSRVAAVFVLCDLGSPSIIGYYTLSAFTVLLRDLPEAQRKRLPRYPEVPTVLLGRLAVDERYAGQGWGKVLLLDALRRRLVESEQIAAAAVVVDAIDDSAQAFYEKYGFQPLLDPEKEHAKRVPADESHRAASSRRVLTKEQQQQIAISRRFVARPESNCPCRRGGLEHVQLVGQCPDRWPAAVARTRSDRAHRYGRSRLCAWRGCPGRSRRR
jgi:GNAT superfamily N-acetyltransferase